jgi:threonine-phosphate decarboxylase
VLDCSVSLNPLGPPLSVLAALRRATLGPPGGRPAIANYPDPDCRALVARLAQGHAVDPTQVVVGNGANDLLYAIARALRPRRAAIVEPTYTEYLRASLRAGAAVDHWLVDDNFHPKPFDPEGADLVWVGNPNNPTGALWPADRLVPWMSAHPQTTFVVDEAFLPFRPDEAVHSLVASTARLANLVVTRSLTKVYTLPGLRLGYAVAGERLAAAIRQEIAPWSVNALAQSAGLVALDDAPFLARSHAWFVEHAQPFAGQLRACSAWLEPLPSDAAFVLVRLKGCTASRLAGRLEEQDIAIRQADNFIGLDDHCVRISVRRPEENSRLLAALQTVLEA